MAEFFVRRKDRIAGPFSAKQLMQFARRTDGRRFRDGDTIRVGREGNWLPYQAVVKRLATDSSSEPEPTSANALSSAAESHDGATPHHRATERNKAAGQAEPSETAAGRSKSISKLILGAVALAALAAASFVLWPPGELPDNRDMAQTAEPLTTPGNSESKAGDDSDASADDQPASSKDKPASTENTAGLDTEVPGANQPVEPQQVEAQPGEAGRPDEFITDAEAAARWTRQFGNALPDVLRIVERLNGSLCVETSEAGQPRLRIRAQNGTVAEKQITDADLRVFARVEGPVHLSLEACRGFTVAGFQSLSQMKQLEVAGFNGCRTLTDEMVLLLPTENLRYLGVQSSRVTNAIAPLVSKMTLLKQIDISNTDVGDEVLAACAGLPLLQEILATQTRISATAVARLRTQRSALQISHSAATTGQVASASPSVAEPVSPTTSGQPGSARNAPTAADTEPTVAEPTGDRPNSSVALIAANPELQAWIRSITPLETRQNVIASIDAILGTEMKAGQIIAVGKIEMPAGAVTLPDGFPAGDLLMHQQQRLDVRFHAVTVPYNGSAWMTYGGPRKPHWPWFVTSLHAGDRSRIQAQTLQHKLATITVPETRNRYSVVLPTVELRPLGENDRLTLKATVTDGDQPLPVSTYIGLSGFTRRGWGLPLDFASGEIALSIPRSVFDHQGTLTVQFDNAFHHGLSRAFKIQDFANGQADIGDLVLRPRQSHMASTLFTTTGTLKNGNRLRLHCDHRTTPLSGSASPPEATTANRQLRVTQSDNKLRVSHPALTHFADLGTDFPTDSLNRPVDSWLDIDKLQPVAASFTLAGFPAAAGHTYLIKCREPQNPNDPRWGLIRIEPGRNAFDNLVEAGQPFGPAFARLAHRLARHRTSGLFFSDTSTGPMLTVASALDDDDARLLASLTGRVFIHLPHDSRLSPVGLRHISRSRAVTYIKFTTWDIHPPHLKALEQSHLTSIEFEDCQLLSNFPALRFPALSRLEFEKCRVDGRLVAALAGCSSLSSLEFEACQGLQGLEAAFLQLPRSVSSLHFRKCRIDPQLKDALRQQRGYRINVYISD